MSYRSEEAMNALKSGNMHDAPYEATLVYFGNNKSRLYAKFYKAVEQAQQSPLAFGINIWQDSTKIILHVAIEHNLKEWR